MQTYIIHAAELSSEQQNLLEAKLGKLTKYPSYFRAQPDLVVAKEKLIELRTTTQLDINLLPENFIGKDVKLVISDMDSTLISIECIDEIADMNGIKPQVATITEAAMRGELRFEESLTKRVALLKGLNPSALETVYNQRLELNPGAKELLAGLKQNSIKFALVSGGFTYFTDRLKQELNLDFAHANTLKVENNQLVGEVVGKIVGAEAKAEYLLELCEKLNINPSQTIAVGDGANDLKMMEVAGLSVAFRAKPTVQDQADCALNFSGLDAMLDFLD